MGEDVLFNKFNNYSLPKSAADLAFLLHGHGFQFVKQDGVMAIITPPGAFLWWH